MNRFKISLPFHTTARAAMVSLFASTAVLLSGCGAGQVSQMANQEPAVNGNRVTFGTVALRDIRMQATQTSDFVQPGRPVELLAVAVNLSPDVPDRLVGITTDIGTVTISGDATLPPAGMLFIGTPEGPKVAPGPIEPNNAVKATINLAKPISNGLTYNFTFNFEKAGQGSVTVPVAAGTEQPQQM